MHNTYILFIYLFISYINISSIKETRSSQHGRKIKRKEYENEENMKMKIKKKEKWRMRDGYTRLSIVAYLL